MDPVDRWFDRRMPAVSMPGDQIAGFVRTAGITADVAEPTGRLVWVGGDVLDDDGLVLHHIDGVEHVRGSRAVRDWLAEVIDAARPGRPALGVADAITTFPGEFQRFSPKWAAVRRAGLLCV